LVVNVIAKYIDLAGGIANARPDSVDEESNKVVDIDAIIGGKHILIDVKVTHPTASTCVRGM
jgi:Holliday junction resolvase